MQCGSTVFNTSFNNSTLDSYNGALASYWKLNETSGSRYDSVGSNHLSDGNSVSYATGISSLGADFEKSSSQYLSASAGHSVTPTTSFAFSLWIKPESTPSAQATLLRTLYSSNTAVLIALSSGTGITASIRQSNSVTVSAAHASTAFTVDSWHHIAFIGNGSTMKLYVNGTTLDTVTYTDVSASNDLLLIGAATTSTLFFDGIIDEVGYWNSYLVFESTTAMDAFATALYNSGSGRFLQ